MLNIDLLSPLAVHSLYTIIKQWQDTDQTDEEELLELLDPESNDSSYLCAEHRPDITKIIPDSDVAEELLHTQDDAFTSIVDGFDNLFLDDYESMQKRLRAMYDNGYTVASFSDELNSLLSENEHLLSKLEWV